MTQAGAAAVHIEDQVAQSAADGPNKAIVSVVEMVDRIKAAMDAKPTLGSLLARTDALSVDGFNAVVDRAAAFAEAGADAVLQRR